MVCLCVSFQLSLYLSFSYARNSTRLETNQHGTTSEAEVTTASFTDRKVKITSCGGRNRRKDGEEWHRHSAVSCLFELTPVVFRASMLMRNLLLNSSKWINTHRPLRWCCCFLSHWLKPSSSDSLMSGRLKKKKKSKATTTSIEC